uniref:Protein SGT1 homolog n=1 Tax=Hirondellea gigas TaxID=1518452 RepID=A0A6A7FS00_9CRUS
MIRHDWYQTDSHVVIAALTKNCNKEDVVIDILDDKVQVIRKEGDTTSELTLHLYQPIKSQQATYKILSSKIEIKLPKQSGERWPTLVKEKKDMIAKEQKNWDRIAAPAEDDEKSEGDAALNQLFQKIYGDADESTKRAMNKSYSESGGTVLSTNWGEVGSKKVDVKAPDGMEYKKWSE